MHQITNKRHPFSTEAIAKVDNIEHLVSSNIQQALNNKHQTLNMQYNIAVPTKGKEVDSHFGHCNYFSIYTLEENKVLKDEMFTTPKGCGCNSNLVGILKEMSVDFFCLQGI